MEGYMKRKIMYLKALNLCNTGLNCEIGNKIEKYNFMFFCQYLLLPYVPLIDLNLSENIDFGDEGANMLCKTLGKTFYVRKHKYMIYVYMPIYTYMTTY
jgi:hypothetical protein